MADTAAGLPIFNRKMPMRMSPGRAALLATVLAMSGPPATLSLTAPAFADSIRHPAGFAEIVRKVKPAVIAIRVKIDASQVTTEDGASDDTPLAGDDSSAPRSRNIVTGQGSGFFVSADGYAVTNVHVVQKARMVQVTTDDGKTHPAKVIGTDPRTDVAVIKVAGGPFPFVSFSEKSADIGDWVIAIGNPFGLGGTVTAGIVSGRGRDIGAGPYDDFLQIDAPVNRGNSGGPAFDMEGNVVGVTTAIVSPSGGSVGIGFAIPAETVKEIVTQLRAKGAVTRGWIGVQIQPVTEDVADSLGLKEARGALVAEPQAGGPAARAGVKAGDVIVAVNGTAINETRDLGRVISGMSPGAAVRISVIRDGQEKTFHMTAAILPEQRGTDASPETQRPSGTTVPELGITVTPQHGDDGVAVSEVDPEGPAADPGLKNGDVILEAAGRKVATARDLHNAVDAARRAGRHTVLLHVKSGDEMKFVAVPLGRG
jgi:serine protease Do